MPYGVTDQPRRDVAVVWSGDVAVVVTVVVVNRDIYGTGPETW